MKICFLGYENLPVLAPAFNRNGIGGEQVQQTLLARALTRRGHQVCMVVLDYGQQDGSVWDGITTYKAYRRDAGMPILRFIHPRWTGSWNALRRANADVYYTSCAGMHVGLLAAFCQRESKRFVYRIAHDTDCVPGKLLVQYWRDKKLYEYGLRRANGILAQSVRQQEALREHYGLDSNVADMLVDPAEEEASRSIDVLWVNNLRQFKRPDLFLSLARKLPHLQFHMIGGEQPGFGALYETIQREAARIPNLTFHGRVPYHEIGPRYGKAKVFVNTSDSEGFPNSYLQSWVRGTPVVTFVDPDGVISRHGLGMRVENLDAMAGAVASLYMNDDLWTATSARCKAYMHVVHGEEGVVAAYVDVLQGVLS